MAADPAPTVRIPAPRSQAYRRGALRAAALPCGLLALLALTGGAAAQTKLEADYRVTMAGLPIGSGGWTVSVSGNRYAIDVNGQTGGLLNLFTGGQGTASVRGAVNGTRLTPTAYSLNIKSGRSDDRVNVALAGGAVRSLSVEPPPRQADDREPLTDAHKRGVIDPFSAGVIPRAGTDGLGPDICRRTIQVFDGRQRFDLALTFKRTETVTTPQGYKGPVVVCGIRYTPIGGFYHGRAATKFLRESREIEVWYAPIAGTKFVAAYHIRLPTTIGTAVLQATRFVIASDSRADQGGAGKR